MCPCRGIWLCIVPFEPYQGVKKGKVASFIKWGLGGNIVFPLMKCLPPTLSYHIFKDNYFTSSRLLTHLGVNNIRATGVLKKNRLNKSTIIGYKQLQKNKCWPLWTDTLSKKSSATLTVVGWNDNRVVYIASSESSEPKGHVRRLNKVERKYSQE